MLENLGGLLVSKRDGCRQFFQQYVKLNSVVRAEATVTRELGAFGIFSEKDLEVMGEGADKEVHEQGVELCCGNRH